MTREERLELLKQIEKDIYVPSMESTFLDDAKSCAIHSVIEELEQEPILDKINKMKSEIADSLEFWDYSPNNNPLARDMLETFTNFLGDIKVESEADNG